MSVGVVKSDELHLQHPNLVARGSTSSVSTFDLGVCHSEWRLLSLVLNNLHHETAYQNRHFKNTPQTIAHFKINFQFEVLSGKFQKLFCSNFVVLAITRISFLSFEDSEDSSSEPNRFAGPILSHAGYHANPLNQRRTDLVLLKRPDSSVSTLIS